ncbi:hypothetical protein BN2537_553 [Streptomyces venezuelae]|nr:hypothetical protein BN2537_553 [Streptomyces venezuelae]
MLWLVAPRDPDEERSTPKVLSSNDGELTGWVPYLTMASQYGSGTEKG